MWLEEKLAFWSKRTWEVQGWRWRCRWRNRILTPESEHGVACINCREHCCFFLLQNYRPQTFSRDAILPTSWQLCRSAGTISNNVFFKITMEDETLEPTWWLSFVAHSKLAPVYIEQKSYIPSKTGLKDKQNKQIKQKTWQYCGEDSIGTSHLQRWRHREVWWSWQCCWGWFAARSWCMAPNENDTCRAQTPCKVCTPVKQNRLFSNAED